MSTKPDVRLTHRLRELGQVEAWFYDGRPLESCPLWLANHFAGRPIEHHMGRWALRDEEGGFWRWMDAAKFNEQYERITP
jgi:hypothetical protein